MAKLQSLLSPKNREIIDAKQVLELSVSLNIDIIEARTLYQNYGNGYIYTHTGLVLMDSSKNKAILSKKFGMCVVITEYGKVYPIEARIKTERTRPRISPKQIEQRRRQYLLYKEAEKECIQMFEDGKGKPSRKHGGKGDDLDMVGIYKYVPQASVYNLYNK